MNPIKKHKFSIIFNHDGYVELAEYIENNNFKINIKGNSKSNPEPVTQIIQQAPTVTPTIQPVQPVPVQKSESTSNMETNSDNYHTIKSCLLYTSDAADE